TCLGDRCGQNLQTLSTRYGIKILPICLLQLYSKVVEQDHDMVTMAMTATSTWEAHLAWVIKCSKGKSQSAQIFKMACAELQAVESWSSWRICKAIKNIWKMMPSFLRVDVCYCSLVGLIMLLSMMPTVAAIYTKPYFNNNNNNIPSKIPLGGVWGGSGWSPATNSRAAVSLLGWSPEKIEGFDGEAETCEVRTKQKRRPLKPLPSPSPELVARGSPVGAGPRAASGRRCLRLLARRTNRRRRPLPAGLRGCPLAGAVRCFA
ncbi:hypothetical protein H5410_009903, partial [Solanum commersonii]